MTGKRWKIHKIQDKGLGVFDLIDTKNNNKYPLDTEWEICVLVRDLLNQLSNENEQLKCGNKNLKSILNDFINICNRLQSNPNDKQTLNVARDMLQNMGVDLE